MLELCNCCIQFKLAVSGSIRSWGVLSIDNAITFSTPQSAANLGTATAESLLQSPLRLATCKPPGKVQITRQKANFLVPQKCMDTGWGLQSKVKLTKVCMHVEK